MYMEAHWTSDRPLSAIISSTAFIRSWLYPRGKGKSRSQSWYSFHSRSPRPFRVDLKSPMRERRRCEAKRTRMKKIMRGSCAFWLTRAICERARNALASLAVTPVHVSSTSLYGEATVKTKTTLLFSIVYIAHCVKRYEKCPNFTQ